jgi:hypothetical protein
VERCHSAAGALACSSSPTESPPLATRLTGTWVWQSSCGCPAPPVTFTLDLAAQNTSVTGTGTWTVLSTAPVAVTGYIEQNTVYLTANFPAGRVVYFRGTILLPGVLKGTWDEPAQDLRAMAFRKMD